MHIWKGRKFQRPQHTLRKSKQTLHTQRYVELSPRYTKQRKNKKYRNQKNSIRKCVRLLSHVPHVRSVRVSFAKITYVKTFLVIKLTCISLRLLKVTRHLTRCLGVKTTNQHDGQNWAHRIQHLKVSIERSTRPCDIQFLVMPSLISLNLLINIISIYLQQ